MNLGINFYTKHGDLQVHQIQDIHFRGYKKLLGIVFFLLKVCTVWSNYVRKPQGDLLSFCCDFEKIIIVSNGKFVAKFVILISNYLAMKQT